MGQVSYAKLNECIRALRHNALEGKWQPADAYWQSKRSQLRRTVMNAPYVLVRQCSVGLGCDLRGDKTDWEGASSWDLQLDHWPKTVLALTSQNDILWELEFSVRDIAWQKTFFRVWTLKLRSSRLKSPFGKHVRLASVTVSTKNHSELLENLLIWHC